MHQTSRVAHGMQVAKQANSKKPAHLQYFAQDSELLLQGSELLLQGSGIECD